MLMRDTPAHPAIKIHEQKLSSLLAVNLMVFLVVGATDVYLYIYVSVIHKFVLAFTNVLNVNKTSTDARLAPGSCTEEYKSCTGAQTHSD